MTPTILALARWLTLCNLASLIFAHVPVPPVSFHLDYTSVPNQNASVGAQNSSAPTRNDFEFPDFSNYASFTARQGKSGNTSTTTILSPTDPQQCAPGIFDNGTPLYYPDDLTLVHGLCPVPLSRQGQRRHRRFPRKGESSESIVMRPVNKEKGGDYRYIPSDPRSWQPWTHRPDCGSATSYCVFTLATLPATGRGTVASSDLLTSSPSAPLSAFPEMKQVRNRPSLSAAPQGISIITTPEMAASDLNPQELALGPADLAVYDAFYRGNITGDAPFSIRPHPAKKGDGVFATRSFRAGELIIVDRPALLAHFKVLTDKAVEAFGSDEDDHGLGPETDMDRAQLWTTAIDQLPPPVAARLWSLPILPRYEALGKVEDTIQDDMDQENMSKPRLPPRFSLAEKIFASNSFAINIKGYPFKALFPNLAKLNHDCRPNLVIHSHEIPMTMAVWASRDIQSGEELTINYLPDLLPSIRRNKVIKRRWGFECQCDLCTGRSSEISRVASDERRARVPDLAMEVREAVANNHAEYALVKALELQEIYQMEGLMRKLSTVDKMMLLPSAQDDNIIKDKPMADPFGPAGLAETIAQLYLATGQMTKSLPYLRAAVAEIGRQNLGWPDYKKVERMWQMEQVVSGLEMNDL